MENKPRRVFGAKIGHREREFIAKKKDAYLFMFGISGCATLALLLIVTTFFHFPYWYYILIRCAIWFASAYYVSRKDIKTHFGRQLIFGLIILIVCPVFRLGLPRSAWIIIDYCIAFWFLMHAYFMCKKYMEDENEINAPKI